MRLVSAAVRRSIHRLSPPHQRPLPSFAAAPALNGESPSSGEAETLRDYTERREEAKHHKQLTLWTFEFEKETGEGMTV